MKDKEKQVEDMAKDLKELVKIIRTILEDRTDIKYIPDLDFPIAKEVLKHYQLKIHENSVVLSMEEFEEFREDQAKVKFLKKQLQDQTRKETAEKILKDLIKNCQYTFGVNGKPIIALDGDFALNVAKQFGVEIKE